MKLHRNSILWDNVYWGFQYKGETTMKIKAFKLNTFAKSAGGGNEAGVVPQADLLPESAMKHIAAIFGFSETAFVMKSNCADYRVRFFTPTEEVDLCGHATVGTYFTLASEGHIKPGSYLSETKAGILKVEVKEDLSVWMEQPAPGFFETVPPEEIAETLNIPVDRLMEDLPVQAVSSGLKDILVPVKNIGVLNSIVPDFRAIEKVSSKYHAVGYHVFTLDSLFASTAHCRNFAPLYGIPEESATGTSNGALGCYLFKYGKVSSVQAYGMVMEQGYTMGKPSEIFVSLTVEGESIVKTRVGGKALNLSQVEMEVPE